MTLVIAIAGLGLMALPSSRRFLARRLQPGLWARYSVGFLASGAVLVLVALVGLLVTTVLARDLPRVCAGMLTSPFPHTLATEVSALALASSSLLLGLHALIRAGRVNRRTSRDAGFGESLSHNGPFRVVVLDDDDPVALSVPRNAGNPGRVIVTTGLLGALSPEELEVVIKHEEAHLSRGHGRYLLAAHVIERAMWFFPPTRSAVRALRFAIERCADEEAAGTTAESRSLLASALLAVGAGVVPSSIAALSAIDGLLERVDAMEAPSELSSAWYLRLATLLPGLVIVGAALAAVAWLAESICCLF